MTMIDPTTVGTELPPVRFPVDRSKLAELARALHDNDSVWHDPEVAAQTGFSQVPVPPTATTLVDSWRPEGAIAAANAVGAEVENLLHGEASWEYFVPVRMGDELTAITRVAEIVTREGRRGGVMTLATLETDFVNQRGELAVRRRDTLIEKGRRI
jgi:acyl dehydratase